MSQEQDQDPLDGYLEAFSSSEQCKPFLSYYALSPDKSLLKTIFTRAQFWDLSLRAVKVLRRYNIGVGGYVCHCFSGNRVEDLAFRLASVMVGCTPVTVNWGADPVERVKYKISLTGASLLIHDAWTNTAILDAVRTDHKLDVQLLNVTDYHVADHLAPKDTKERGNEELKQQSSEPTKTDETDETDGKSETKSSGARRSLRDPRIVIFTSGTTGNPKGVNLTYSNYETNRKTFEDFLQVKTQEIPLWSVVVNPLHHANSTSITDWALRRPGTHLHLFQRYTTQYWRVLTELGVAASQHGNVRLVAPSVSRHFDILESLVNTNRLPVALSVLKEGLSQVDFLIGSAPVGPSTVSRLLKYTGRLPLVRFGSTETCLQVMGTPRGLTEDERMCSFRKGWAHIWKGEQKTGYYIGQQHPFNTEVKIVQCTEREAKGYMVECKEGEPGYIITRGGHIMSGYVANESASFAALHDIKDDDNADGVGPWYVNLGDVGFWLRNRADGNKDVFWMSRDSALLIRGGANYAYEQINNELSQFIRSTYSTSEVTLSATDVQVAVVGLKLHSEHEDDCCVTIEFASSLDRKIQDIIVESFMTDATAKTSGVSKGAKPSCVRVATIPRNFKGAILVKDLKAGWTKEMASRASSQSSQQ